MQTTSLRTRLPSALPRTNSPPESRGRRLRLRVQREDGREQTLDFADLTEADALRRAGARGLRVLSVETLTDVGASPIANSRVNFPLVLFSQELLALLDAGLNLTKALTTLHAKERVRPVRQVLGNLLRVLREGNSFSDVLAAEQYGVGFALISYFCRSSPPSRQRRLFA